MANAGPPIGSLPRTGLGLGLSAALNPEGYFDRTSLSSAAQAADIADMAGIWVPENVLAQRGCLDPLVLLGWVAAVTEQIALGTAVLLLPYQHPYRMAQRLAALDLLSGGRLIAGVGSGAKGPARFFLVGEPVAGDYERDVVLLSGLLRGERVHDKRVGWPAEGIRLDPLPARPGGPPLWLGGGARPALERAARMADGWIASGSIGLAAFTDQLNHLQQAVSETGRSRGDFVMAKRVYIYVDDDPQTAAPMMKRWFSETWGDPGLAPVAGVSGTADQCASEILALRDAGADLLILDPVANLAAQTKRIVEELVPQLAG